MKNIVINILIASFDNQISQDLVAKLKDKYKQVSFEFDIHPDGQRALSDFKIKQHHLLILTSKLPGLSGERLIQEVLKHTGSASIILLGEQPGDMQNYEFIKLPILSWTDFFNKVQNIVSDDVRTALGVQSQNSVLVDELQKYCSRYKADEPFEKSSGFHTLPYSIEASIGAPLSTQDSSQAKSITSAGLSVDSSVKIFEKTFLYRLWLFDLAFFLIMLVLCFYFFIKNQGAEWSWISIPGLVLILTISSGITFFSARVFDVKFLKSKN